MKNIRVETANHGTITSHRAGHLQIGSVTVPAYEFSSKDLSLSLLSVADLDDLGHSVTFAQGKCTVTDKQGQILLCGKRSTADRLYRITTQDTSAPQALATITSTTITNRVIFLSQSMGSPIQETLMRAIRKGWLRRMPLNVTSADIARHLPNTVPSSIGHQDM